jgi:hypothetical protein
MPAPTKRALKAIAALAKRYDLPFDKDGLRLADKKVALNVLYAGGNSLARYITDECKLSFVQIGSKGEWLAILPASELTRLLELEVLYSAFSKKAFAKWREKEPV